MTFRDDTSVARPRRPRSCSGGAALAALVALAGCGRCAGDDAPDPEAREGVPGSTDPAHGDRDRASRDRQRLVCHERHYCAIMDDGHVECWGDARKVRDAPDGSFASISAGRFGTCGLRTDGRVECWGMPESAMRPPDERMVWVGVGGNFACGLRTDMTPGCWSSPNDLRPPTGPVRSILVADETVCWHHPNGTVSCDGFDRTGGNQPGAARLEQVAIGSGSICGIEADGRVRCWDRSGERTPIDERVVELRGHPRGGVCALTRDGRDARCFGFDERYHVPARVDGPFQDVRVSQSGACGIREDGTPRCWGEVPEPLPSARVNDVAHCGESLCAVREDGSVRCVGHPYYGQTDAPDGQFVHVSSGRYRSCALRKDDRHLVCWGLTDPEWQPPDGAFRMVELSDRWGCGLRDDGRAVCWGNARSVHAPPSRARFRSIALGPSLGCGVTTAGGALCWGSAHGLELPRSGVVDVTVGRAVIVTVEGGRRSCFDLGHAAAAAGRGGSSAMAWHEVDCPTERADEIVSTGSRVCWTAGGGVQCEGLAGWSVLDPSVPTIADRGSFHGLVAGHDEACALDERSEARCWGDGGWGETDAPDGRFEQLAAGWDHVCGLTSDGRVRCWGGYAGTPL